MSDKVQGYYFLKTLEEMDRVVADTKKRNSILIRRDFAKEYFTPSGLTRYVNNARRINRNLTIESDERSDVLTVERFIRKLSDIRSTEEALSLMTAYPKEFIDVVKFLADGYSVGKEELLAASNKVSRLQAIIDEKNVQLSDLRHSVMVEQENKMIVQSKLSALVNRINYQYNADVDESKMFSVDKNSYDKIIYIKEITRVQFVDSFVFYLKEIMKVLYSMPVRLTIIEGYYANGKVKLYPDLVPHYKLRERDVLSGDILMLGMQPKLMEDILRNPSSVSILIVLDRGGYFSPHIKGENVEYFYTVSDLKDINPSVPKSRIISYDSETLFIPLIEGFGDLDEGERIARYSSTEIVKRIVTLVEGR
jgi:hypothetical protein